MCYEESCRGFYYDSQTTLNYNECKTIHDKKYSLL